GVFRVVGENQLGGLCDDVERVGLHCGQRTVGGSQVVASSGVDDEVAECRHAVDGLHGDGGAAVGEGAVAEGQCHERVVRGDDTARAVLDGDGDGGADRPTGNGLCRLLCEREPGAGGGGGGGGGGAGRQGDPSGH